MPSRLASWVHLGGYLLVLLLLWLSFLPLSAQLIASVLCCTQGLWLWPRQSTGQYTLQRADGHRWRLIQDGQALLVEIVAYHDWRVCLWMRVRETSDEPKVGSFGQFQSLTLWCDQLSAPRWRRLRASLRWRHHLQGVSTVSKASGKRLG